MRTSLLAALLLLPACNFRFASDPLGRAQDPAPLQDGRSRARALGLRIGDLPSGPHAAITDVPGVRVGHATVEGDGACTGVTVVLPHGGNLFRERVPAAVSVANGFGKPFGFVQIEELGELEAPIALTGTLNVPRVADALLDHALALPGNERVRSVNPVVLETNDGLLNDLRARPVRAGHVAAALAGASAEPPEVGCVGAGTGTICFGWKGGIGSASRAVAGFTVGVLVQTNFGGRLTVAGTPVPRPDRDGRSGRGERGESGSCAIVVATDAPLCARNLRRLAARAFAGMARTGASFGNGSGDYAVAFSTAQGLRRGPDQREVGGTVLGNAAVSPLFVAVADATEEAILDSLCAARTTTANGRTIEAVPLELLRAAVR